MSRHDLKLNAIDVGSAGDVWFYETPHGLDIVVNPAKQEMCNQNSRVITISLRSIRAYLRRLDA